ncbi:hypothetical protein MUCCIDRAFT_157179 [Mucor lusitanicus CBS 277.49]|uniref:Protein prenyltransferase n=2 Tax=Mucor circinelloides f. lusitanicus TaxID=29924 RepID=A0A168HXT8_MUCCL|nr:hypothetical protein MUCCIDRAFT_157179 [Mucor lusitanicus CBS 277.49]
MQLYQKLCHALDNNEINELGLLPMIPEMCDVPPESQMYHPLIVVENKLGIAKQCLAILLKEAHEHFVALNENDQQHLEQATRVMILLKPDNYTAINRRKQLIQSKYIQPKNEIALLELIFTIPKHSKSSIAWYHRQWIFAHYADLDVENEFKLCTMTSMLYPRNYYAWTYRHWVLSNYCALDPARVEQEYKNTCQWIERNISDFSGFQYLQQVMEMHKGIRRESHMQWLDTLIIRYPGHESLWCHRRFCSHLFVRSEVHCYEQHAFIENIMQDVYKNQSLALDNVSLQKEFALKFGLFHLIMEKQAHGHIFADASTAGLYLSVAPTPHFMDLQGGRTTEIKGNFECN